MLQHGFWVLVTDGILLNVQTTYIKFPGTAEQIRYTLLVVPVFVQAHSYISVSEYCIETVCEASNNVWTSGIYQTSYMQFKGFDDNDAEHHIIQSLRKGFTNIAAGFLGNR